MIAQRPPMGWNTYNTFGRRINEQLILESTDAFIDLGLKDAGYEYVVIDDCWSMHDRDPITDKILPDPEKFPHGMKYISDYVHAKGLKFGMYSCAGVRTCADFPGSFEHEYLDAQTFAEYGCDYLKYDYCNLPEHADGPYLYRRMGMALRAVDREILFSACNWGMHDVYHWIRSTGAHMYRSTGDISDSFGSFSRIAAEQEKNMCYSAPFCYNDTDMLTVGMYGNGLVGGGVSGCNDAEYRMQFSMWCMFSAPLMLGCDIRKMNAETLALVTNKNLLRINQDPEARTPIVIMNGEDRPDHLANRIYFKHLSNNEFALAFYNLHDQEGGVRVLLNDLGLPATVGVSLALTDVFTNEPAGQYREVIDLKVPAHDCKVFLGKYVWNA